MKKIIAFLMVIVFITLVGCGFKENNENKNNKYLFNKFCPLEKIHSGQGNLYIAYDIDTKVMYYITFRYESESMSPIYDSNGEIMIYEGE